MELFNRERLPLIAALILAVICLSQYIGHLWVEWGPILRSQPLTAPRITQPAALDFPLPYTASYLALAGEPASVYNPERLKAEEKELTGGGPHPWPYPPTALLLDLPLALLPYFWSLALWLTVTMGLYLLVLYRIAPHPLTLLWALAFFGTFENFFFGQNGFVSAALLGGGLLLLESSPFPAGLLLGLLSYKPHVAALVPLALMAGGRWRALTGAVAAGAALTLVSAAVFGLGMWEMFWQTLPSTISNLHAEAKWFHKMPSIFAAVRAAGYGVSAAWICHGVGMLAAVGFLVWVWRGPASPATRSSALALAILLFSPHLWYYDLTLLALPLAWLWWEGQTSGWLGWERLLLILSWVMPLLIFWATVGLEWPHGPLYLVLPLIMVVRRFLAERRQWRAG